MGIGKDELGTGDKFVLLGSIRKSSGRAQVFTARSLLDTNHITRAGKPWRANFEPAKFTRLASPSFRTFPIQLPLDGSSLPRQL